jgi:histidinol-phosphate aminotransferase
VIDVPLQKENFMLDVTGILAAVNGQVRIVFISNPNNPTGAVFPERDIRKLIGGLPGHVIVVYDEVYHHYVDRRDYVSASTLIGEGRPVIGVHSFSKAYGLAGIRLAYLFSTPAITGYLRHFRRPFMIPALSMLAGLAAIDDFEHLSNTVRINAIEKKWLYEQLRKQGIMYWKSDANFILVKPPGSSKAFCTSLLKQGVMVRNAEPLGAEGMVRITVGTMEMNQTLIRAIQNLKFNK